MFAALRLTLSFLTTAERARLFVLFGARALAGLLDAFGIALIGLVTAVAAARLSAESGPGKVLGFVVPTMSTGGLLLLVVAVLAVFVLKAAVAIVLVRTQARFVARIESRNATDMIAFLIDGPMIDIKAYSSAEIQFTLTSSTTYAFTGLLNNFGTLLSEGFLLLVVTATLVVVDPTVAVFTLLYFGIVVLVIQVIIGRSVKSAARHAIAGTVDTTESITDVLDAFREIAVLRKQRVFAERIAASRRLIAQSNSTLTFLAGMPRYVVETTLILGVVILVAQQFLTGGPASGLVTVGVFLTGGVRIMASLLPVQSALANLKQNAEQGVAALRLLERMREVGSTAPSTSTEATDVPARGALTVELEDVHYRYPGEADDVIRGISMRVEPGIYAAIIGPSGAGKTTLVDLLLGLLEPSSGTVRADGLPPSRLQGLQPGSMAYVPQSPGLVSGTIADNIALGLDPASVDRSDLERSVAAAHLSDFVASLPGGLATSVGKQNDALSGGQIQRVGVARALHARPRLLVLDEATSGLDAGSEEFISRSLEALHGDTTLIVIAHRLSTVQHADVVFVVDGGRIVASGDFASVRASNPLVERYVQLMSFDAVETPVAPPPGAVGRRKDRVV